VGPIRAGALDPVAQRGLRQPEVAGRGGDGLAFIEYQPDGAGFELVGETASRPLRCAFCHGGHRIPLSEDVHETGSIAVSPSERLKRERLKAMLRDAGVA
jgi:hypothetical protein